MQHRHETHELLPSDFFRKLAVLCMQQLLRRSSKLKDCLLWIYFLFSYGFTARKKVGRPSRGLLNTMHNTHLAVIIGWKVDADASVHISHSESL